MTIGGVRETFARPYIAKLVFFMKVFRLLTKQIFGTPGFDADKLGSTGENICIKDGEVIGQDAEPETVISEPIAPESHGEEALTAEKLSIQPEPVADTEP